MGKWKGNLSESWMWNVKFILIVFFIYVDIYKFRWCRFFLNDNLGYIDVVDYVVNKLIICYYVFEIGKKVYSYIYFVDFFLMVWFKLILFLWSLKSFFMY